MQKPVTSVDDPSYIQRRYQQLTHVRRPASESVAVRRMAASHADITQFAEAYADLKDEYDYGGTPCGDLELRKATHVAADE